MNYSVIVATDLNGCIGKQGKIPWKSTVDMDRFKMLTVGKVCVMGKTTYESCLEGKPLENGRYNVVLSNHQQKSIMSPKTGKIVGCYCSLERFEELIEEDIEPTNEEIMVIGGEQIYNLFLPKANRIYKTVLDLEVSEGTAWFKHKQQEEEWNVIYNKTILPDPIQKHWFTIYQRKTTQQ